MSDRNRTKIAVVGAGAVGGFFGTEAATMRGNEVRFCVRTPFERLIVESDGEETMVEVPVHTDPSEVGIQDCVLLAVKAHQTSSAGPWLQALCGPETLVAVLQNGVEHAERVAPYIDGAEALPTIVRYGGELTAPGHVVHYTYGYLFAPEGEAGRQLATLFEGSKARVELTSEFAKEAWSKLVTNVAANAIPAITERRFPVFRRPDVALLAEQLMSECIDVAQAEGVTLDHDLARTEVERLAGLPDNVGSSMLYDRIAARPLEYDALNGAVVRIGQRNGVETPMNRAIVALLGAISDGAPT